MTYKLSSKYLPVNCEFIMFLISTHWLTESSVKHHINDE